MERETRKLREAEAAEQAASQRQRDLQRQIQEAEAQEEAAKRAAARGGGNVVAAADALGIDGLRAELEDARYQVWGARCLKLEAEANYEQARIPVVGREKERKREAFKKAEAELEDAQKRRRAALVEADSAEDPFSVSRRVKVLRGHLRELEAEGPSRVA